MGLTFVITKKKYNRPRVNEKFGKPFFLSYQFNYTDNNEELACKACTCTLQELCLTDIRKKPNISILL